MPTPYSNNVEVGVSSAAQGGQRGLKNSPRGCLAAACAAHNHGGVAGVLGLIQLNDLGEGEWRGLQAPVSTLLFNGLLQLREGKIQEVGKKGGGMQWTFKSPQAWEDNAQTVKNGNRTLCTLALFIPWEADQLHS